MQIGERILVVVSERIGDVIFCTPAIGLLRASKPESTIAVLAPTRYSAQILDFNPAIDCVYIAPSKKRVKALAGMYDTVIDLHGSGVTQRYVQWLGKTALTSPRIGYEHQSVTATRFIRTILNVAVDNYDESYRLYPQMQHKTRIESLLKNNGINLERDILIGCHMGNHRVASRLQKFWRSRVSSPKSWPLDKFVELQKLLYKINPHIKLVLTGQSSEKKLAKVFDSSIKNIVNLVGQTTGLELAALMPYLKVFLTGCTGPLHVAVAMRIPVVAFYGPTFPDKTGPYPKQDHHVILQVNPLTQLQAETVCDALLRFL